MLKDKHITIIGAGNMAEALITGMLSSKVVDSGNICATDVDPNRLHEFERRFSVLTSSDNREASLTADIIILAVKPQVLGEVLIELDLPKRKNRIMISVVAGTSICQLSNQIPFQTSIIRAMPNTPAIVLEGVTALACGSDVSEEEFQNAEQIFLSIGKVVRVPESVMDTVTGLSGSGPAYVYTVIEGLIDGGVKMGLSRQIAHQLATQTVLGTAKLMLESGEHPGVLRDRVTSPGGTTMAGLHELEKGKLRATLMNAVESASLRSKELGLQAFENQISLGKAKSLEKSRKAPKRK